MGDRERVIFIWLDYDCFFIISWIFICGIYKFIVLLFEEGEKLLDLLLLGKIWYFFGYKEIIINEIIFICYDIFFIILLYVIF